MGEGGGVGEDVRPRGCGLCVAFYIFFPTSG